ncbi:hypothetical protein UFOVP587_9 [uncultured Caudovirales phage]|uniref:Uncharacterized protein n=1 Tax=uncultured Caudovirales phage TaxID=2100421 RepID=A0A6J5MZ95_9CAUD|nr:hypothetical protein UFOVP587_9 [uncultured Caudovirales phage]
MASKPKISFGDDLLKQILKMANIKTTRELKVKAARGISMGKSPFPKVKPKPIPKPTKPIVAVKPKPKGVGKIAAVKPERPVRDFIPRGATLPKSGSVQRGAEKSGSRRIAISEGAKPPKKGETPLLGGGDTRGSIVVPPTKASLRPPKPAKGSYEANPAKVQETMDRRRIGQGQARPKAASTDPKARMKFLQDRIKNPTSERQLKRDKFQLNALQQKYKK